MADVDEYGERKNDVAEALDSVASALRSVAGGQLAGPSGLEALAMALAGQGLADPVASAIRDGLHEIAEAIREVGDRTRTR